MNGNQPVRVEIGNQQTHDCWEVATEVPTRSTVWSYPIASMYGIFSYIYHKNQPNVGKYTIHGWYGYC